ncbi:MAG: n-acetylglutamate synthase [Pyrinomonadaceae bacterium]
MMINLEGRKFVAVNNTGSGQVGGQTVFHYHQQGTVVWADYAGGSITRGHLIAVVDAVNDYLQMRYHHIDIDGELRTGTCVSRVEILPDRRIRLHERWQWTSGDRSRGKSVLEEIP